MYVSDVPSIKVEPKSGRGHCSEVISKSSPQSGRLKKLGLEVSVGGLH